MRAQFFFRIPATILGLGISFFALNVSAQLAITEVMSSASTNLGSTLVAQSSDFWELTNFGTDPVNLNDGYRWNDAQIRCGGRPVHLQLADAEGPGSVSQSRSEDARRWFDRRVLQGKIVA